MLFRGLIVGAASGKLGAMVASHNKGGQYMRARVTPSGAVPTPEQSVVRNAVSSLASAWSQELTQDQRDGWANYALNVPGTNALGDAIQLSGQNWFIACNTPRLQAELARVDDAPLIFDRGTPSWTPSILALTDTAGTVGLGGSITAAGNALLYGGRPFSGGRSKYYGSFRLAEVDSLSAGASTIAFTPPFSIGTSGTQMEFRLVLSRDDGRLSAPFRFTFQKP